MSTPSNIVSESSPHYSRASFYKSMALQFIREEKKVFNMLRRVLESDRENLERSEEILPYVEYLTKLTTEYNTLAHGMRKIAASSFS